nr:7TM-DISM domain-containing protein [Pedobacter sp. ASV19]
MKNWLLIIILSFTYIFNAAGADIVIKNNDSRKSIGKDIFIYVDKTRKLDIQDIRKRTDFIRSTKSVPNFGVEDYTIWIRFSVLNQSDESNLTLQIDHPVLDNIELYSDLNNKITVKKLGEAYPFKQRIYNDPSFIFQLDVPKEQEKVYYMRIESSDNIQLPIFIGKERNIIESTKNK